jgi:hypothetical protein
VPDPERRASCTHSSYASRCRVPESCPITISRDAAYAPLNFLLHKRGGFHNLELGGSSSRPSRILFLTFASLEGLKAASGDIAIGPITSDHAFVPGSWARLAALLSQSGREFGLQAPKTWSGQSSMFDIGQLVWTSPWLRHHKQTILTDVDDVNQCFELTGEDAIRFIYVRTFSLAMTWRQLRVQL